MQAATACQGSRHRYLRRTCRTAAFAAPASMRAVGIPKQDSSDVKTVHAQTAQSAPTTQSKQGPNAAPLQPSTLNLQCCWRPCRMLHALLPAVQRAVYHASDIVNQEQQSWCSSRRWRQARLFVRRSDLAPCEDAGRRVGVARWRHLRRDTARSGRQTRCCCCRAGSTETCSRSSWKSTPGGTVSSFKQAMIALRQGTNVCRSVCCGREGNLMTEAQAP